MNKLISFLMIGFILSSCNPDEDPKEYYTGNEAIEGLKGNWELLAIEVDTDNPIRDNALNAGISSLLISKYGMNVAITASEITTVLKNKSPEEVVTTDVSAYTATESVITTQKLDVEAIRQEYKVNATTLKLYQESSAAKLILDFLALDPNLAPILRLVNYSEAELELTLVKR